uniref:Uncharacterized protein n=1 Tax=Triticum urartu TaxID=4572 RepID=A0A8R7PQV1_TRIUA
LLLAPPLRPAPPRPLEPGKPWPELGLEVPAAVSCSFCPAASPPELAVAPTSCRASYPLADRDHRWFRVALTLHPCPQFFYLLSGIPVISMKILQGKMMDLNGSDRHILHQWKQGMFCQSDLSSTDLRVLQGRRLAATPLSIVLLSVLWINSEC